MARAGRDRLGRFVLHEEEPVVEKRAVPKERVRLEKDTVTDEREVTEEVRKERIEHEGGTQR
jgi:stress response protein YsnF